MNSLTQERLKELLAYDRKTGVFTWKVRRLACTVGKVAGSEKGSYRRIGIDNGMYYAHRLAWLYVYGAWPAATIDHRDGDRSNNKIKNLREATSAQNSQNRLQHKNNSSGFTGVVRSRNEWQAQIMVGGKAQFLGRFKTPEDAHQAYLAAKTKLHTFSPNTR